MWEGQAVSVLSSQVLCGEMVSTLRFNVESKRKVLMFILFHSPCFPKLTALLGRVYVDGSKFTRPLDFLSQVSSSYTNQPCVNFNIYHLLDAVWSASPKCFTETIQSTNFHYVCTMSQALCWAFCIHSFNNLSVNTCLVKQSARYPTSHQEQETAPVLR